MWLSREAASCWYNYAYYGLIFGCIIVAVSTFLLFFMGNEKEKYLKLDVEQANKEAAAASERAALLEKQAEEERIKRLRIEQGLASRHITEEQRAIIKENLIRDVAVSIMELADEEAEPYADEIADALRAAGAMVEVGKKNVFTPPPIGVRVRFNHDDERATAVFSALKKAGIDPVDDGASPDNSVVYIRVGIKAKQF